jgi:hypothetical protein
MLNTHAKKMAEKIREETNFIEPADSLEPFDLSLALDYSDSTDSYRAKKYTNGFNSLNRARQPLGWLPAGETNALDDGEQINRNTSRRVQDDDRSRRKKPRAMEEKQAATVAVTATVRENHYK